MRITKKLATACALLAASAVTASTVYAADNAFQIDEINWTQSDWESIAMTNDDTVQTGAVIRTQPSSDSDAAGYLYRGAAAKVIDKGEEWTLVESGKVTGYVKNEYLMFGDDARGLAAHYGKQGITANWDEVNVYSGSSPDAAVSQTIDSGTALGMIEDNGHWIAVQKDKDSSGYVSEEDVSRVLLVDTAVPADGEDIDDVAATMTAEDITAAAVSETAGGDSESAEYTADDSSSYSEEYSNGEASSDEASQYQAQDYTENAQDYGYTGDAQDYTGGTQEYTEETYTAATVSDDAGIQALYEAYIAAQNAAMSCTSEEDANAKAAAATDAWNAYLAACGQTASASSPETAQTSAASSSDSGYTSSDTYEETSGSASADDASSQTSGESSSSESGSSSGSSGTAASTVNSGSYSGYSDLDLLAAIIWCEAGNQPYDGMVAVGQVVMNRVKSSSFPNTIAEVLDQPGQFTPASSGTLQAALAAGINSTCYSAASDALNGAAPVPGTPLYFNTHSGSYKLGDHYFS